MCRAEYMPTRQGTGASAPRFSPDYLSFLGSNGIYTEVEDDGYTLEIVEHNQTNSSKCFIVRQAASIIHSRYLANTNTADT